MSTLNNMITSIKENLGNRSSGVIGGTPVDTVVLAAINKGFKNIVKQASPDFYDRVCTVALVPGTAEYAVPTADVDSNPIKVKQITGGRLVLLGETSSYRVTEITKQQYLMFDTPNTLETGVPSSFALFNNKLYFVRYPDASYTLTLAVNVMPADFTVASLNITLSIDDLWIEVIEAYAAHYCFAKLQQMADAQFWYSEYNQLKREAKSVINKRPMQDHPNQHGFPYSDPISDPFVKRWN